MTATRFSTLRLRSALLAAAVSITASACGGGSDSIETTAATTDAMPESTVTTTASTDAMPESTTETTPATTDSVPDDTMTESTESTEAPGTDTTSAQSGAIGESTTWTSPDGAVTMEIDPTWTASEAPPQMLGRWAIGASGADVRVLTQTGVDVPLKEFLDTAVTNVEQSPLGTFTVVDSGVRTGPNGSEIGYLEYIDTTAGPEAELHLMQTVNIANGRAAIAAFRAPEAEYAALSESVIPYIETIQAL